MGDAQFGEVQQHVVHLGRVGLHHGRFAQPALVQEAGPGRPQDRPAVEVNPGHVRDVEFHTVPLGHEPLGTEPLEAVVEADDRHAAVDRLDRRRPYHPVDPRRRPAAHQYAQLRSVHA